MNSPGWETKKLGEVCSFLNRGVSPKYLESGGIAVLNQRCIRGHQINTEFSRRHDLKTKPIGAEKFVRVGDVLVNSTGTGTLGRVAQVREEPSEPTTVDSHVTIVRPIPGKFYPDFFGYVLRNIEPEIQESGDGCGGQIELARSVLSEKFAVKYPTSIFEQQRIVRILDEAFDAIATAKVNVEKNLKNARSLFETHLETVFNRRGEGWEKISLGKATGGIFTGPFGSLLHKSDYIQNGIPLINPAHISKNGFEPDQNKSVSRETALRLSNYILHKGDIVIGRRGEMGRCALVTDIENGWLCGTGSFFIKSSSRILGAYLVSYLRSNICKIKLEKIAGGAVMPNLSNIDLGNLEIDLPPIEHQESIVNVIDSIRAEVRSLESIYLSKISTLDALKQSLLHQAFSGQLTSTRTQSIVPFSTKVPDITPTDLHAGILAIAYNFHEARGNLENYGHVKAEKIAHMVEAHLGIDLERTPVKDAAGPNDYPRSRKVEHRARMAGFFDFHLAETGAYQVKKLPGFDKLILRTREKLGDRVQGVIDLMNLMVGMTTRQAEIFATVYAAWNNLLLDGKPAADEDIVTEARENWHIAKMDIPREKFFNAIGWIRERNLMPKGMGKRVAAKQ
jgi:type I restriction enzyme S subunit